MNLLIVSATSLEIKPLLEKMEYLNSVNQKLKSYKYVREGNLVGAENLSPLYIDVLIPGPGMTATAYWMGKTLAGKAYDAALNLGLAGSFNFEIEIGEVVNVEKDWFSEMGAEDGESFLSLLDMELLEDDDYPMNQGEIFNNHKFPYPGIEKFRKVKGITVNKVHGNEDSIKRALDLYHPDVESMEGAAFLYASEVEKLPSLQLRAVSNYMERRNRDNWNIGDAVNNLCIEAQAVIDELN